MKNTSPFLLIIILLGIAVSSVQAQNLTTFDPSKRKIDKPAKTKQQLATEFYVSGEYLKASELFEELYKEKNTEYFYKYLLFCYIQLDEFRKAERLVKKATSDDQDYKQLADLGYIQLKRGNAEKANKMFLEAIEELPSDRGAVNQLARDFRSRGQTELSKATYIKGRELLKDTYTFNNELASLYYYLEQYESMTDHYLNLLENEPLQIRTLQYRFQNAFRRDKDDRIYPYLKKELLQRIRKDSDKLQYRELLLWLSIQRKDFNIAIIQAKSLDRRGGTDAYRVFDLTKVLLGHGELDLCIESLDYLLNLADAKDQIYYIEAKQILLSARFLKLQQNPEPSQDEINFLNTEFETTLIELGKNRYTVQAIMDYSEFLSFYLQEPDKAILELENLLANKSLRKKEKAPVKILLGDLYLLHDNPWDATLLYSQVDKDFKNDEIGFEAKLKNAQLSFYIGEFGWAKAQLDVLKSSTGKKIANNAMQLSLFIAENLDADSSTRALELFGKAEMLHHRMKDSIAMQTFDSIFMIGLYHEIFDDVWYRKAQIFAEAHAYDKSIELLEQIIDQYPDGLITEDAIWMLADIEMNKKNNTEKAAELYKLILTDHPASLYSQDARNIFRSLNGEYPENENADSL